MRVLIRQKGLVSVVVTSFNRRQFLLQCLNGLVAQTYKNIEIVLVDDGSWDGTVRLAQEWKRKLSPYWQRRVIIAPLPRNIGYPGALTTALFFARGEFIAIQDSDDVSHPQRIARQVQYFRNHPGIGMLGTNFRVIRNGKIVQNVIPNWLAYGEQNIRNRYRIGSHCITCGSVMMRGRVFDRIGGFNRRMPGVEDYEFIARAMERGVRADNLKDVLYYVRQHPQQLSRKMLKK